jgi:hypothetical protein
MKRGKIHEAKIEILTLKIQFLMYACFSLGFEKVSLDKCNRHCMGSNYKELFLHRQLNSVRIKLFLL